MPPAYRSPILDPLGLGAAMFGALGILLIEAHPRAAEALGRALDTRSAYDVTARSRHLAATAAERLGLASRVAHLDRPSFHGDGPSHSSEEPAARVVPITQGESRDHRPTLNHVMIEWIIEHLTDGPTELVAERALSRAATLQQFANPQLTWMSRVPATLRDAQAVLRQADPPPMTPLADD